MVEPACASRRLLGRFWQLSLQDFTYRSDTIHMPEPCSLQATRVDAFFVLSGMLISSLDICSGLSDFAFWAS